MIFEKQEIHTHTYILDISYEPQTVDSSKSTFALKLVYFSSSACLPLSHAMQLFDVPCNGNHKLILYTRHIYIFLLQLLPLMAGWLQHSIRSMGHLAVHETPICTNWWAKEQKTEANRREKSMKPSFSFILLFWLLLESLMQTFVCATYTYQ